MKKKILFLLLVAATIISAFQPLSVKAETPNKVTKVSSGNWIANNYVRKVKPDGYTSYQQMSMIIRVVDGQFVYCIQPGVPIDEDITYYGNDSDWAQVAGLSKTQWERIRLLSYYGYQYGNHTDIKWYVITQNLIWQTVAPDWDIYYTDSLNGNRIVKYTSEIAELNQLVAEHNKVPSFDNVYREMVIGETIELTDTNGVLNNFNVETSNSYVSASKSSNTLYITANAIGETTLELTKRDSKYDIPPIVYVNPYSQNVIAVGSYEPMTVKAKLKIFGGKVTIDKLDKDTGLATPQGEATLGGAVYGIYKENGEKVGTITTKANGSVQSDYLPCLGRFYVLEEKASEGYQLDYTKYYFDVTKDNLLPEIKVYEKIINRDIEITKVYASDKTGIMTPEPNAKFGFYNNKGELVKEDTSDQNGRLVVNLVYGNYTVKQLTSTLNYEKAKDFTITIKEVGESYRYTISNSEITAKLKVIKVDKDSGDIIARAGIKFKILNLDTNSYVKQVITYPTRETIEVFETDINGILMTAYPLNSGRYLLEEVDQKIDGYLWNSESLPFEIGENSILITDSEYGILFETKFENQPVKGEVQIKKTGEVAVITKDGFEFKTGSLEGVTFGLFASEDIVFNNKVVITKGTKVAEKITDKDGDIVFDNLYLGKYYLQEIKTLDNYILDETKYEFELVYKDQYTPVIVYSKSMFNKMKTGKLEFTKTDLSESKSLPNAVIEIYNEQDELLFSGKTNFEGKIIINRLPQGKYYIIEKEAPEGYKLNEEKMYFEIKDNGEVIKSKMKDEDITGTLEFTKVDFSTDEPLPNTLIEIYDANTNELIFSGRTDLEGKIIIDKIKYGKYYIMEKEAPEGYQINTEKMYFEIKEDGKIIKSVMKDEQIVKVPNTDKTDYKEAIVGGVILVLLGAGAVIYGNNKRKK